MNELLNNDKQALAKAMKRYISSHKSDHKKADEGVNYYNGKHAILENRIFYVDGNGQLREDKYASNVKITHQFMTELVKQKVQFLLSNPIEVETENDQLSELLNDYYNEDFQLLLQDVMTNASQKGFEYIYARTTSEDKLTFQIADGLKIIPIYDENNNVVRLLRHYTDKLVDGSQTTYIHHAELYDDKQVWYFIAENKNDYELDKSQPINPKPHVLALIDTDDNDGDPQPIGRDYGRIPFFRFQNNQQERTDLEPIKSLIDDYDLMDAFLSNNLQDFADALYVVKGFNGSDLSELKQNLKSKKAVGVTENGGVDVKTVEIPVTARKTKLELDRENIYKFGFGFDSSQVGDGNVTNVVIKGRYTLLNMKANETEARLRSMLKWINELVIADINRLYGSKFLPTDVKFNITREMLVNENDLANNEKTEAETRQLEIQTLLSIAPLLDDQTVLQQICDKYELDFEEVQTRLALQDYDNTNSVVADGQETN